MNLEELIFAGLDYIGLEKPNEITVNLIIEVRKFLLQKSEQWYEEKFPEAYRYDIKERRKALGRRSYKYDGIKYYINSDKILESCILHKDSPNKDRKFSPPLVLEPCLSLRCEEVENEGFEYINEIDHFFAHCINNSLLGKEEWDGRVVEAGINAIRQKIINESVNSKL